MKKKSPNDFLSKESERIVILVFCLMALGTVMIYSASAVYAQHFFGSGTHFLRKQIVFVLLGFFALLGSSLIDPDLLRKHSRSLVFLSIGLMALVFVPGLGKEAGGAKRWLNFFAFSFQPTEIVKVALVVYLSDYLVRKGKAVTAGKLGSLWAPAFVLGVICFLLFLEPDLGSIVLVFMISSILFFVAGLKMRVLFSIILVAIPALLFLIVLEPYRMQRVMAYLNPWQDPRGSGFQIIQSFLAFALGGWNGVGLGSSTQKLFYLPQGYNDFVFSILGEELGILGTGFVVVAFAFLFHQGVRLSGRMRDPFRRMFIYGLILLLTLQSMTNMLVTTGLIPTKGLPIPFLSYGGTSLIFNMAVVGLILAADRKERQRALP